jgi:hypothetical protein
MIPTGQTPSWWKRITTALLLFASAAAGVAAFTGSLEKAKDSIGKLMGWGPKTLDSVTIRDGVSHDYISPDDPDIGFWTLTFTAVVVKSGDQPLNYCTSEIKIQGPIGDEANSWTLRGTWAETEGARQGWIQISAGDHQELHRFEYPLIDRKWLKPGGHIQIRMLCDDLITPWFPLLRVTAAQESGIIRIVGE